MTRLRDFSKKRNTSLYLSTLFLLVCAFTLTVLPLPDILKWVWPQWALLTVIHRVIIKPDKYGIYFAFFVGLMLDLLLSNKLGIHALSYSFIAYCLLKMQQRIYMFPLVQQVILIFLFAWLDLIAIAGFSAIQLNWIFIAHSALSSMTTAMIWLFIVLFYGLKQELSKIR